MYLRKKTSIWLAIGTLVSFFAIGIFSLRGQKMALQDAVPGPVALASLGHTTALPQSTELPRNELSATVAPEATKGAEVQLNRFERSETKNGKLVWQVRANRGDYFPAEQRTRLERPELSFFRGNGGLVEIRSTEAQVYIDGVSLTKAELLGNVQLVQDKKTTITTAAAAFDRVKNVVTAPGAVTIETPQGKVTGTGLVANIETQTFELQHDVATVIKPRKQ